MSVELTLLVVDWEQNRHGATNWLARTALEITDGTNGERFFDLLETELRPQEVPDHFRAPHLHYVAELESDADRNRCFTESFYGGKLRYVTAGGIVLAVPTSFHRYRCNHAALIYLSVIDPTTPVVLRFH